MDLFDGYECVETTVAGNALEPIVIPLPMRLHDIAKGNGFQPDGIEIGVHG